MLYEEEPSSSSSSSFDKLMDNATLNNLSSTSSIIISEPPSLILYDLLFEDDSANLTCLEKVSATTEFYRFLTNGILLNLIGVLGIFGNIISMIILSRPQMRSSINYILIGLARVDTLLIITSILLFGIPGIYPYTGAMFTYFYKVCPHLVPIVYPLATVVQTASVYLTVLVSLDRFVAVCHPLQSRFLCTYGRARIYVIAIVLFSLLYNLPRLFEATINVELHPEMNVTIYCARPSALRTNETYITVYVHWCYLIFLYLIPFVGLAVLNVAIYRQVRRANKERQRLSRLQRREIGLATMLLCVVMVFIACNILPLVINIIEALEIDLDEAILDRMVKTSNLLVTINSSVNFIIYVIFGEKFKRLFLQLFCNNHLLGGGGGGGRDSPDGATMHDDSFMSNGGTSIRLHRQNTAASRNGISIRIINGSGSERDRDRDGGSGRINRMHMGPCVYYPAARNNKQHQDGAASVFTTDTALQQQQADGGREWERQQSAF